MAVINLAEYAYKLTLDSGEYTSGMKEAETQAEGMKAKLSSIGSFMTKTLVAGMAAAGAAVVALGTQAVTAYSEYEQLIGGVETLFKESADVVNEYAANAYKTAGMSANTYMETVTSFSASLLQSLGGDTVAAAEVADMAIADMSDNANKMGSDIESIQNAYQGFAKQNYTMLDNLKLGYGGTKEEMARLLADAEKLSGQKYDISNLNDVYEAIHVVQTELGITGTTAKEASTTIQGSAASMKAAWSNLLVGMADENQNFDALLENLVDSIGIFAGNLLPRIEVALNGVAKLIISLGPQIAANLLPKITEIATSIGQNLIDGLTNSFPKLTDAFTAIQTVIESVVTTIQGIIGAFVTLFTAIWDKWGADIVSFAQTYFNDIMAVIQNALDLIQGIAQLFIDIFTGNWNGVFEDIKNIASTAWELIKSVFQTAVDSINGIATAGFTLLGTIVLGLMDALWTGIQNVWASIVGWFNEAINGDKGLIAWFTGLGETFFNIGASLLNWVWDGLKSVWESIVGWVQEKVDWIADKLSFWNSSQSTMSTGGSSGNISIDGSHANGLAYVPFDGYTALLHRGERVLTAQENAAYNKTINNQSAPVFHYQGGNITINGNADNNTVNQIRDAFKQEISLFINNFEQYTQTHKR